MMLYTPLRNAYTKGLSMAERMAAFAGEEFRGHVAGTGIMKHAAITFVWTIVRSFLLERKQGPKYDKFKRKLYADYGLEEIMLEIERIRLPGEEAETNKAQAPNVIAQAWHQALIESAPKFSIPSVYGKDADVKYRSKEEWWMDDYDAFVNALKMIPDQSNGYAMLWSGSEVANWYRCGGEYQDYLEIYFSVMFNEAMQKNAHQGLGVHLLEAQYKKLKEEIRHKEWEDNRSYEPELENEESTSSTSNEGLLDGLQRVLNAGTFGVAGTNKEIIDALHLSGKISGDQANRAKSHDWSPNDLLDDDDLYS